MAGCDNLGKHCSAAAVNVRGTSERVRNMTRPYLLFNASQR